MPVKLLIGSAALLVVTACASRAPEGDSDYPAGEYRTHVYVTGKQVIDRPFAEVKADLLESLAPYTAADAYARYDAGATREDFVRSANASGDGYRPLYRVYEIRWEVPIFIDTGTRKDIYRIGLGGGPGRHLLGEYPGSGLHVIPSIQIYAQGAATVVEFVVPSSQYAVAFPDNAENRALGRAADERFFAFLEGLRE